MICPFRANNARVWRSTLTSGVTDITPYRAGSVVLCSLIVVRVYFHVGKRNISWGRLVILAALRMTGMYIFVN